MKSVRLFAQRDLRITDDPLPEAKAGEVLLRIRSVGVCASDMHYYEEGAIGDAIVEEPLVLGHEVGAEVAAIGEGVHTLKPGDLVAVEPSNNCGVCPLCISGLINLCPSVLFFGTPPTDGALREYVAWPEHLCLKLPSNLSLDEAAMTEPMAVGIYAVDMAGLKGGETIAILGAGAIGLSVMQAARVMGAAKIWIVDPLESRRLLARKLGADFTLAALTSDTNADIWEQAGGCGPDIVYECAGTNEAVGQAVQLAAFGGRVIVAGIPFPDEVKFTASLARRKNLTLEFVRRSRNAVQRALDWASENKIDIKSYVTHHFPLDQVQEAMELARDKRDGVLRVVITV